MGHAGYEFYPRHFIKTWYGKWQTTATHHNMHHKYFNGNYGLYFSFWDKWMKTERKEYEEVFDQTFAITGALQLLAVLVAFIGILSALLSWQLDKQREIGILRAIGLTTRQMWRLVMIESGLLGGVAGVLALPTGYTLALILIYIINKRSFGWTLQMHLEPEPFIQAIFLSVLAALVASIYPALKISHSMPVEALRSE